MKPFREISLDFDRTVGAAIEAAEANVVKEFILMNEVTYHVKWGILMGAGNNHLSVTTDIEVRIGGEYGTLVWNFRGDWTPTGLDRDLHSAIGRGLKKLEAWRDGVREFPATLADLFAKEKEEVSS